MSEPFKLSPASGLCVGLLYLAEIDGHVDEEEMAYITAVYPDLDYVARCREYKGDTNYKDFIDDLTAMLTAAQSSLILKHFLRLAYADEDFSFFERQFIGQFCDKTGLSFDEDVIPDLAPNPNETKEILNTP